VLTVTAYGYKKVQVVEQVKNRVCVCPKPALWAMRQPPLLPHSNGTAAQPPPREGTQYDRLNGSNHGAQQQQQSANYTANRGLQKRASHQQEFSHEPAFGSPLDFQDLPLDKANTGALLGNAAGARESEDVYKYVACLLPDRFVVTEVPGLIGLLMIAKVLTSMLDLQLHPIAKSSCTR
jgi:hypothetical protein